MKYCVEYSKEQDQFHIETSEERFSRPINGYRLIGYFDTEDEAYEFMEQKIEESK